MLIIFIAGAVAVVGMIVQMVLQSRFAKYSKIPVRSGMTGADIARKMLADNGIYDVTVVETSGMLTDHYNPVTKTVALSSNVYGSCSVAAAAVAAHECGHAVQHAAGYAPLKLRSSLVPIVNFSSRITSWLLLLGVLMIQSFPQMLWAGIILFSFSTLFSLITLPVEVNASTRAISWLSNAEVTDVTNHTYAIDALKWAAYTYFVAAIGSIATLLYYVMIALGNRD